MSPDQLEDEWKSRKAEISIEPVMQFRSEGLTRISHTG